MNITTRQLTAFLLVARHRNFSRAAEQMYIAQSGLSLMIRELEQQLGFRLFDRTTRQVKLTEFGSQFLSVAEQNVQAIEAAISNLGGRARAANLTLSVAAPPMAAANLLPEAIAAFQAQHPEVSVRLTDTSMEDIARMVKAGEVDLGLGMFIKPRPGVLRTPVFRFSLMVVSRPGVLPPARRGKRRWAELVDKRFIGLPPENPIQQLINKHLNSAGHAAPPAFEVNFLDTQIGLVAAGCGIAILPSTASSACRNRGLQVEALGSPEVELDFYQVSDRSRQLPQCAADFTELLKRHALRSF